MEVCFSPALLPYHEVEGKTVVVIDVFRASSAITAGLDYGIKSIIPVADLTEAKAYKEEGYTVAAERHGEVVDGFDFGNSPFDFMQESLKESNVVLTTSNGTRALSEARKHKAGKILIGCFNNFEALCSIVKEEAQQTILLCAGWKNKFNLEDTLFAGSVINAIDISSQPRCDSAIAAEALYSIASPNIEAYIQNSSHAQRLKHLHIERDIKYCLQFNKANTVPIFKDDRLVRF